MKLCKKCQILQPFQDFAASKKFKDGLQIYCKKCHAEYYQKNKERIAERNKQYYRKNPNKRLEKNIKMDQYYKSNKENILNKKKTYYKKHYSTIEGRAARILSSIKIRSKFKNYDFNLTVEWIADILSKGKCQKSGIEFSYSNESESYSNPFCPSVDRIDNSKGYTIDNCQIVVEIYNKGKGQNSDDFFIEFCRKLTEFNSSQMTDKEC